MLPHEFGQPPDHSTSLALIHSLGPGTWESGQESKTEESDLLWSAGQILLPATLKKSPSGHSGKAALPSTLKHPPYQSHHRALERPICPQPSPNAAKQLPSSLVMEESLRELLLQSVCMHVCAAMCNKLLGYWMLLRASVQRSQMNPLPPVS